MSTLAFALVLFGCSDDLSQCVKVRSQPYESISQCRGATTDALRSEDALTSDYPTMTAICMSAKKVSLMGSHVQDFSGDWH